MDSERAFTVLELDRKTATPDAVKSAHRRLALKTHPDAGGSDAAMAELNDARDVALEALNAPTPKAKARERCSCRGFKVNPFCAVHGKKDDGISVESAVVDECKTCLGEKRVKSGPAWSTMWVACPDCAVEQ